MKNNVSNRAFSEAADIMGENRQYGDKGNVHVLHEPAVFMEDDNKIP